MQAGGRSPLGETRGRMRYQRLPGPGGHAGAGRAWRPGWPMRRCRSAPPWLRQTPPLSQLSAGWEMLGRAGLTHHRPTTAFAACAVGRRGRAGARGGRRRHAFGNLLRFRKEGDPDQPRVLLVAPLSGHFATLLRGTVRDPAAGERRLHHRLANARDAPLEPARSASTTIVEHVIASWRRSGRARTWSRSASPARPAGRGGAHGEDDASGDAAQHDPDGRAGRHPDQPDQGQRAGHRQADRLVRAELSSAPCRRATPGAGRRVYPGFMQLTAFMSMNLARHVDAHVDMFGHLAAGRTEKADRQSLLRRIFRRAGSDGRVLPGDRRQSFRPCLQQSGHVIVCFGSVACATGAAVGGGMWGRSRGLEFGRGRSVRTEWAIAYRAERAVQSHFHQQTRPSNVRRSGWATTSTWSGSRSNSQRASHLDACS